MINSNKLKGRIVEKGLTMQLLAPKIGCTPYTLGQKISNESPMYLEEVIVLVKELDITSDEFADFFLNEKLQNTTNNIK